MILYNIDAIVTGTQKYAFYVIPMPQISQSYLKEGKVHSQEKNPRKKKKNIKQNLIYYRVIPTVSQQQKDVSGNKEQKFKDHSLS
jgi:hypothetical protein